MRLLPFTAVAAVLFAAASHGIAADSDTSEAVAAKLAATTVTVRISTVKGEDAPKPAAEGAEKTPPATAAQEITVCTGVSLGKGLIVTFSQHPVNARIRVTLANGEQAEAEPRVIDHYSGLRLLEIVEPAAKRTGDSEQKDAGQKDARKTHNLPGLEIAAAAPAAGGAVWTAAAAGIEKPALSLGILSGADRSLPGTDLPPLLQCDVRTTETSSGAAVVNRAGELIGIVAATAAPGERSGWTYAVPAQHVKRLQLAIVPNQLIELKRQRPVAGLTVGPGDKEGLVVVERITAGGPAEKAGLKTGDVVLEAEGSKIRSAYQAVELILKRQPGEKIGFVVDRGGRRQSVELTLGGAAVQPNASIAAAQGVLVGPQLTVKTTPGGVEVRNSTSVQELSIEPAARPRRSAGDEVELLKAQLLAFEQVIHKLQTELQRRGELQLETDKLMKSLQGEVEQLHKQLDAARSAQTDKR